MSTFPLSSAYGVGHGDSGPVRFEDFIFGIRFLDITGYASRSTLSVSSPPFSLHICAAVIYWSTVSLPSSGYRDLPWRLEEYIFGIPFSASPSTFRRLHLLEPHVNYVHTVASYLCATRSTLSASSSRLSLHIDAAFIYWSTRSLTSVCHGDIIPGASRSTF